MITINALAAAIGVSTSAIEKNIRQLKDAGVLERKNGDRGGHWDLKFNNDKDFVYGI